MKKILFLSLIMAFAALSSLFADDQPAQQGNSSQEVVVKGQLKGKIDMEMPDIQIKTDTNKVAQSSVATEEQFLSIAPEDVKDIKASLPDTIDSERAQYHPEYSFLETPPVFRLQPKMPKGVDIDRWNFKVTDATGATVKLDKGNGNLPDELIWDGFDRDGNILKMGSPYWYVLTYMDKAGNPGSARRETPKVVNAIRYQRDNKIYIEISSKVLFEEKRQDRLTDPGKQMLEEVRDYMKMSNNFPVSVKVYSEDSGLSGDQIRTLEKLFTDKLKCPKEFFKMDALQDNSVPKNYRVVFIINA